MKRVPVYVLTAILFAVACSPKVTETPVEIPSVEEEVVKESPDADTPCATFNNLSSYDRDRAETAYVLYRDEIKLNNYENALSLWKTAYNLAPASNGRVKYQYDDGIQIYKHFFDKTSDEDLKEAYVDTIMSIYDKRQECFGEEAYIKGRKAFDYYYFFKKYTTTAENYDLFRDALNAKGEKADYFIINPMTKMLYDGILEETISIEEGQETARKLRNAIQYGTDNCKKDCEAWKIIGEYAPVMLEALEGIDGFYDCDYYSSKYYPQFLADSSNCETINLVYARLLRGGCQPENPQVVEIKATKDTKCYTPPPANADLVEAYKFYNEGKYTEAVSSFEKYIEKQDDVEKKAKYLLVIGKIYYGDLRNFPKSRKYALEAAKLKENWGEPYMLIGKLYASSGPLCGPGRGWDSQIVTWPAIDKFRYAKRIDPSVSEEANKLIAQYSQYMPKKEDLFFRSLTAGQSFRVPCWIQETTTIRTSD